MRSRFFQVLTLLMTAMIITLTACSTSDKKNSEEYKTPDQLAKERQTEIIECFINKDGETLKSFFSEYIIENYDDIDTQIDEALNFLDGEIVSYDKPFSRSLGSIFEKYYGGDTRHIITDKDTEYKIVFHGMLRNDEEPEKVGVSTITVINITEGEKLPDDTPISERIKLGTRVYIGEPH